MYSENRFLDDALQIRNMQAFGEKTIPTLNKMKIGVVGCSGTGSPVIEQLQRFGVGELVLVYPDFIDKLNINRILSSTLDDAINQIPKVNVMSRSIHETGFGTKVITFPSHISEYKVINELAECDILFGCVDGSEAFCQF